MPTTEMFNDGSAFNKMQRMSRCPFASGQIAPDYTRIRHESFADRNLGTPYNVGSTAGSIAELEEGGDTALAEGGSHISFYTQWRGGKEDMRNPYNTFQNRNNNTFRDTHYGYAPDAPHKFNIRPSGRERFIGSRTIAPQVLRGSLPAGLAYT